MARGWWRRIQSTGFSLQQLVLMAEAYGASPQLIALTAAELQTMPLPLLVHLQLGTGPHFSVLTGIAGNRVTLADPVRAVCCGHCLSFSALGPGISGPRAGDYSRSWRVRFSPRSLTVSAPAVWVMTAVLASSGLR